MRALALLLIGILVVQGCAIISYDVRPREAWDAKSTTGGSSNKLYYRVDKVQGLSMGGAQELRHLLRTEGPFRQVEPIDDAPARGTFVRVATEGIPPSIGSLVWGYISMSFLFAFPAYSGTSGFVVKYRLHRDGKEVRLYEYEIRRKGIAWLPVLAVVWVNLFTASDEDAFRATTRPFFQDAKADGLLGFRDGESAQMARAARQD